jgi:peptide/nickel transport system permease protein
MTTNNQVDFDPKSSQVVDHAPMGESYWQRVWTVFNKRAINRSSMWLLAGFATLYVAADLIANGSPLILSYQGQLYSPWLQRTDMFELAWCVIPALVAAVILAFLSRRTGRKRFLVVGLIGVALTYIPSAERMPTIAGIKLAVEYPALPPELQVVGDWRKFAFEMPEGNWALFAPIPYSMDENDPPARLKAPQNFGWGNHLLGTDDLGRDLAARLVHGTRVSLLVGFVSVSIYVFIGLILGGLAGFYGGWIDLVLSRIIEVVICFPSFFLIITVLALIDPSIWNIMIVIGVTRWTGVARLFRAEVLKVKNMEYIAAARAMGNRDFVIILRHVLPNAIAPVLVSATFGIAGAILVESSLSFLGFGVQAPTPSWGEALSLARTYPYYWWIVTWPGVLIFLTVTAYNLAGEGLRDATDPRQV